MKTNSWGVSTLYHAVLCGALLFSLLYSGLSYGLAAPHGGGAVGQHEEWPEGLARLLNREGRIGGFWINGSDYFYFTGDTKAFDEFLTGYSRLKHTGHKVVLHAGRKVVPELAGQNQNMPYDWLLSCLLREDLEVSMSEIPFHADFVTSCVKIYLETRSVKGWNAIDAVGLVDNKGAIHWARSAEASSTRADEPMLIEGFGEQTLRTLREGTVPFGPGQAVGPPDCDPPRRGHSPKVWEPRGANDGIEWLVLEYPEKVLPTAVQVYEVNNPGAVSKVAVLGPGGKEVEVWTGKDPSAERGSYEVTVELWLGSQVQWEAVGIPENVEVDWQELTELHIAAGAGQRDRVQQILADGADIDARDAHGNTALHTAVINQHTPVVELLLAQGADINAANKDGITALHKVARTHRTDLVALLLAHGADVHARDKFLSTPLHWAELEPAELVLKHGANIEARDNVERTPLIIATSRGNVDLVTLLLAHGARSDARDKWGNTPLAVASKREHGAVVELLLQEGATE